METLAKRKECEIAGEWLKSIVNHMYWCAASTEDGNGEVIKAKWLSTINKHSAHIENFPNVPIVAYIAKRNG